MSSAGGLRMIDGGRKDPPPAPVIPIATKAGTRFVDVVGMRELKKLLRIRIIEPFVNPGLFQKFRRKAGGGVLLSGPPGCGKTLMARAIAGECKATFINVGIGEIMSMWIGESERNLGALFEKAREYEVLANIIERGSDRSSTLADLLAAIEQAEPSTLDWLRTTRNLVKFGGRDRSYKDVEAYLKLVRLN